MAYVGRGRAWSSHPLAPAPVRDHVAATTVAGHGQEAPALPQTSGVDPADVDVLLAVLDEPAVVLPTTSPGSSGVCSTCTASTPRRPGCTGRARIEPRR